MASLFTSWIGPSKLNGDAQQGPTDDVQPRTVPMPPVDRATSMTPKAHFQFAPQSEWSMSSREHHREVSEATLNGRSTDGGVADRLSMASRSYDGLLAGPTASRPTSMSGDPTQLSHERLAALSGLTPSEAAHSSVARRRKKIAPPELLVIVKPPPSKQTNPLNLQIQLVMPQQLPGRRESSQRRSSMDSSVAGSELPTTPSNELRRRDSITSTRSAGSEASGVGSIASTSSGRRVTPLYNLNFHQILSTTVSDAGTDQKVAKYIKKGIDLDGFGILEPAELITGVNDVATLQKQAATGNESLTVQASNATNISPRSETDSSGGAVDDGSAFSAPAREKANSTADSSTTEPPTSFEAMTPEARGVEGNLGGKLLGKFKRFSLGVRPASASAAGSAFGREARAAADRSATGASAPTPSLFGKLSHSDAGKGQNSREIPQMLPGAGSSDGKRTEGYFWSVRKWNRKPREGASAYEAGRSLASVPSALDLQGSNPVLTSVWKRFNIVNRMGGNELHPPPSQIPVRFEWSRNSRKASSRRHTAEAQARLRTNMSLSASVTSVDRHTGLEASRSNVSLPRNAASTSAAAQSLGVDEAAPARLSTGDAVSSSSRPTSFVSRSPRRSLDTSTAGSTAHHGEDDSGDESDPEDSETPWNCHLVLGPTTRIPLGTLSPAPHHPKLVGQLAVPFPLPDLSGTGLGPDGAGLTREELKDVIIVTCLHLIVRESFGGLARRRSAASVDTGANPSGAMANANGWRLANIPKKPQ